MKKRSRARLGALIYIGFTAAVLSTSISMGWLGQERRDMTTHAYERHGPLCGFVRGLPFIRDYVGGVPCQVWNLMPLTGLAAIVAGWLIVDVLSGAGRMLIGSSGTNRQ